MKLKKEEQSRKHLNFKILMDYFT